MKNSKISFFLRFNNHVFVILLFLNYPHFWSYFLYLFKEILRFQLIRRRLESIFCCKCVFFLYLKAQWNQMLLICPISLVTAQFFWLYSTHKGYRLFVSLNIISELFAFCLILLRSYLNHMIPWSSNPNEFYKPRTIYFHLFNILKIVKAQFLLFCVLVLMRNLKCFYLFSWGIWKLINCD